MKRIRSTLETIFETYKDDKYLFLTNKGFIHSVKMLDRSSIMDKEICDMIVEEIPKLNKLDPLKAEEVILLQNFFLNKQHFMSVRTKVTKLMTELSNNILHDSIVRDDKLAMSNDVGRLSSLALKMRGYDYQPLNKAFEKHAFTKSVF